MNKEYIVEQSIILFRQSGIKRVTMDDISRKLGISKRTLYAYFYSKRDLIKACLRHIDLSNTDSFTPTKSASAIDNIIDIYMYSSFLKETTTVVLAKDLKQLFTDDFNHFFTTPDNYIQHIRELIEQDKQNGMIQEEINSEIVIYFLKRYIRHVVSTSRNDIVDIIPIMLRGICTPKGLSIVEHKLNNCIK